MDSFLRRRAIIAATIDPNLLYKATNIVCTGSNFFDTGFAPFSEENINKDFKITFKVSSFTTGNAQAVILGCKYEGTLNSLSYPGIYVRRQNSNAKFEIGGYNYTVVDLNNFVGYEICMWRQNGSWFATIGEGNPVSLNVRSTTFNQNIVLGAGVQTNGNKFRNAICTIDYIKIEYI